MTEPQHGSADFVIARGHHNAVRVVAGGNHVTTLLHANQTLGALDAIQVLADPGGGPPPHWHAFAEWFYVTTGVIEVVGERDGTIRPLATLGPGDSVWVPSNSWHGTRNASKEPARFLVLGLPATMTAYFDEAGVEVADEHTQPHVAPPGPAQLAELAARHGISFR